MSTTSQFPDIDDILGGIMASGMDSSSAAPAVTISGNNKPEPSSIRTAEIKSPARGEEADSPKTEVKPLADIRELIDRLPGLGDDENTYMVRIYFDILSTLRACDFGTRSIPKIVNAILINFIERNIDDLRAIARKTYL